MSQRKQSFSIQRLMVVKRMAIRGKGLGRLMLLPLLLMDMSFWVLVGIWMKQISKFVEIFKPWYSRFHCNQHSNKKLGRVLEFFIALLIPLHVNQLFFCLRQHNRSFFCNQHIVFYAHSEFSRWIHAWLYRDVHVLSQWF